MCFFFFSLCFGVSFFSLDEKERSEEINVAYVSVGDDDGDVEGNGEGENDNDSLEKSGARDEQSEWRKKKELFVLIDRRSVRMAAEYCGWSGSKRNDNAGALPFVRMRAD